MISCNHCKATDIRYGSIGETDRKLIKLGYMALDSVQCPFCGYCELKEVSL